jgi:hypothetical protein
MQIVALAREWLGELHGLCYAPDIPEPLERAARAVHADALPPNEQILLLYDDTLFGGAEDGFVLTPRRLCWKALGERPRSMAWSTLETHDVRCGESDVYVAAGKLPLTAWDSALAARLTELLRMVVAASSLPQSAYREAAARHGPLSEDAVIALARRHLGDARRMFLRPDIPARKELGARDVHADHLPPAEAILVLYDDTVWGSGRDGFVLTPIRLCWKDFLEHPSQVPWNRLGPESIKLCGKTIQVAGGTLTISPQYGRARDVAQLFVAVASGVAGAGSPGNES